MKNLSLKYDDRLDALASVCGMLSKHLEYSHVPQQNAEEEAHKQFERALLDRMNGEPPAAHYGNDSLGRLLSYATRRR